jgi:HSP20 family protein
MTTLTDEVRRTLGSMRERIDAALERLRQDGDEDDEPDRRLANPTFHGPDMDIEETAEAVIIRAELPGLDPGDFSVEVARDRVLLRGVKETERHEDEQGFRRLERRIGSFMRVISLPAEVDPDAATAAYRDGVLHLMLPKTEAARARRIRVEVAKS